MYATVHSKSDTELLIGARDACARFLKERSDIFADRYIEASVKDVLNSCEKELKDSDDERASTRAKAVERAVAAISRHSLDFFAVYPDGGVRVNAWPPAAKWVRCVADTQVGDLDGVVITFCGELPPSTGVGPSFAGLDVYPSLKYLFEEDAGLG